MEEDEIILEVKKNEPENKNKKSNKKKKSGKARRFFLLLKIVVITIISLIVVFLIFNSSLFNIKQIDVTGNSKLSENKVISISSLSIDTNIFHFNKENVEKNLIENAYIEDVTIKRKLPSTVEIIIKERIPSYMLQFTDSYVYINNQGYMLEISNEKLEIPIIVGFTTDLNTFKVGNRLETQDLKKMNMVIKIFETAKNVDLSQYISKIDISNTKEYKIEMESLGKVIYLGDATDLNSKMLELKEILHKTQEEAGEVFLNVDLNTQRAYFRRKID